MNIWHDDVQIISPDTLMIFGICFEILGALFLSMESIGFTNFKKIYKGLVKLSAWFNKNTYRSVILIIFIYLALFLLMIIGSNVIIALCLPLSFFVTVLILLLSNPAVLKIYVNENRNKGRIGPIGFLVMVFGFAFQLSAIVWGVNL